MTQKHQSTEILFNESSKERKKTYEFHKKQKKKKKQTWDVKSKDRNIFLFCLYEKEKYLIKNK